MTNYNDFEKSLLNLSDISIRLDRKQLINQLRALQDNYIELWINSKNLKSIILKDRYNINRIITKN
jgi:hypothetical protein